MLRGYDLRGDGQDVRAGPGHKEDDVLLGEADGDEPHATAHTRKISAVNASVRVKIDAGVDE